MKEIETDIIRETSKFVESLSSAIITGIIKKLLNNKKVNKSVTIYR